MLIVYNTHSEDNIPKEGKALQNVCGAGHLVNPIFGNYISIVSLQEVTRIIYNTWQLAAC